MSLFEGSIRKALSLVVLVISLGWAQTDMDPAPEYWALDLHANTIAGLGFLADGSLFFGSQNVY